MGVKIRNGQEFIGRLNKRMELLSDMDKPMKKALDYMEKSIVEGTIVKQRTIKKAGNRKFAPLKPSYAKKKQRLFPGAPILVRTGNMLSPKSFWKTIVKTRATTSGYLRYRGKIYGNVHQAGSRKKHIRKRSWFGYRTGDNKAIRRILGASIGNVLRKLRHE